MLGRIPFVSMSDSRLGGMENSSLRYLSATRALEFSTSRMVSPSFSRSVRRLFPAGSIACASKQKWGNHIKAKSRCDEGLCKKLPLVSVLRNPDRLESLFGAETRGPAVGNRQDQASGSQCG